MAMSRNQNAGQNHKIKMGNTTSERVKQYSVWDQPKEIKIPFTEKLVADRFQEMLARIFCFTVCYPNISMKIKTHGTTILPVVYGRKSNGTKNSGGPPEDGREKRPTHVRVLHLQTRFLKTFYWF
jgi:hypothetical protein